MSLIITLRRQAREAKKSYEKDLKARTEYGVFMHIPNANGYVVRSITDGFVGNPYSSGGAVARFKYEKKAQEYANSLNKKRGY